jgi:hypothetical protein
MALLTSSAATAAAGALQRSPLRGVKPFHHGVPPSPMQLFTGNSQLTCLEFSTAFSQILNLLGTLDLF